MSKDVTMTWQAPQPLAELRNPDGDLVVTISRKNGDRLCTFPIPLSKVAWLRIELAEELPRLAPFEDLRADSDEL